MSNIEPDFLPVPLTDDRFPGLHFEFGDPTLKKDDPRSKDRIVSDDTKFNIFDVPDTSVLEDTQIDLIEVAPFESYTRGVAFLDCEWVGSDGGSANGNTTDVLVAIGIKLNGKHYLGCNPCKSEKELLTWFFDQLSVLPVHTIAGYSIYGFFRDGYENVPVDLAMIYHRARHHGLGNQCPWQPVDSNFSTHRFQNAIVFGKPLEVPAWQSEQYELIDLYPQTVLYDGLVRKLDNYRLKDAVIGFGLRDDRRIEIGDRIYEFYAARQIDTIKTYLAYDLDDSELLWNFLIPQKYFMKQYLSMSLQRITTTGTGSWWNQFLIKHTGTRPPRTETCSFQGALTFYHAGVYRNCVKLDFSALYPSIMLTWLICSWKDADYISLKTLKFLIDYRKSIKKTPEFRSGCRNADGRQHTAKILANSLFGLWNTTGLAFNDPYSGAAITAYGRNLARYMITWLDTQGVETVGLDTDGAICRFKNDTFTDAERHQKFTELTKELNDTLPGFTRVEYEDSIPFIYIPPNLKQTQRAAQQLADKLNSIECYDVSPDQLIPGLSKNYLYFTKKSDGTYKLAQRGKFKKRDKSWLEQGFVIELITKMFYDGDEAARQFAAETRTAIASGEMPVEKLQKRVLVASNWREFPRHGFLPGNRYTIHYVWRGETTGKRVIKKVFAPSDNPDEPYATEYYLAKFDEVLAETGIKLPPAPVTDEQLSLTIE